MMSKRCMDYDSMGNHGRFPVVKKEKKGKVRRVVQKLMLWVTFKFPKKERKSIWKL